MSRLRGKAPAFVAETPAWCAAMSGRVKQAADGAELTALWRDEITPYTIRAFFYTMASATDLPNRLELELRDLVGADDASALLSNLGGLSTQLESLGPLTGLGKVARGEMSRDAYLAAYGHRGVNETEYAWPRPLEDPAWLDRQLAEFASATVDVESLLAKQRSAYAAAWGRFGGRYPRKVNSMRVRLEKAAWAAHLREAVRSEATRSTIAIRAFALRAGELTGLGEDVFFLTIDEVLATLAGDNSARRFVAARKETHRRYSALPTYPTIIVGRFDPFAWAADPKRRGDVFNANAPAVAYDAETPAAPSRGSQVALGSSKGRCGGWIGWKTAAACWRARSWSRRRPTSAGRRSFRAPPPSSPTWGRR